MIISILVNILGQIGTAKWEGSTTGDGGTGSGDTCARTPSALVNFDFQSDIILMITKSEE